MHTFCEYVPAYLQAGAGLEAYVLMYRLEQAFLRATRQESRVPESYAAKIGGEVVEEVEELVRIRMEQLRGHDPSEQEGPGWQTISVCE